MDAQNNPTEISRICQLELSTRELKQATINLNCTTEVTKRGGTLDEYVKKYGLFKKVEQMTITVEGLISTCIKKREIQ